MDMKIVIFGGSGTLGTELQHIFIENEIITPSSQDVDICNYDAVRKCIENTKPDIIINTAAIINNVEIEKSSKQALHTNIIGSANIAAQCNKYNIRLVYISTDYIYSGDKGSYLESDDINPVNLYAWTKLGGECSVKCVKNHLIVRTSFGSSKFPYTHAFTNQYTSKDYVDIIAPMIAKATLSSKIGVINIGTDKKSMHDYAIKRNKNVQPSETLSRDHSLNINKYYEIN